MITRTAMIAIVGRPNAGKSTLTNRLTGEKIAIVSPKPQTTRNRIFGVYTSGDIQIVLLDTPGFHKARTRLGEYMVGVAKESVTDVDAAALVIEPVPVIGKQEELLIEHFEKTGVPALLVINKIDTVKPDALLPVIETYSKRFPFDEIVPISAKTGDGVGELSEIFGRYSIEGPQLFPDGMTTDQQDRQMLAEIIREKLLICLDREIPHGTAVEITAFGGRSKDRSNETDETDGQTATDGGGTDYTSDGDAEYEEAPGLYDVESTIYCEKASHKGIIIGKHGAMLKKIGQRARVDMEEFLGAKVFLQVWVKVKENWRDSKVMLRNFGYTN